ncbi:hypothetical protein Amsp01_010240 [Amycolatopsis sp. NBRC 101858]|uniref:hypothetical protein n=1 Tax=Amycolatopsis sp. NBRC 101858 TaxID=3032200 RepID=UPI0024A29092|nr:hypothetical protein [Amycolatopsis sp. NBRC 101858]GLY35000.1 hypothetical protein Amsp01_010240 [Amycolatopsis sp. NBRC 101858]
MGHFFTYLGIGLATAFVVNLVRMLGKAVGAEATFKIICWVGALTFAIVVAVKAI